MTDFEARRTLRRLASDGGAAHGDEKPGEYADMLIAKIEAEATAAAEQRLRERIGEKRPVPRTDFDNGWNDCRDLVLRLLDTPSPASPRQGEPVTLDVERIERAVVEYRAEIGRRNGSWTAEPARELAIGLVEADTRLSTDPAEPVAPDKEGNG